MVRVVYSVSHIQLSHMRDIYQCSERMVFCKAYNECHTSYHTSMSSYSSCDEYMADECNLNPDVLLYVRGDVLPLIW